MGRRESHAGGLDGGVSSSDVWRVTVEFSVTDVIRCGAVADPGAAAVPVTVPDDAPAAVANFDELERHLKRFPGSDLTFDRAANVGVVDVVVQGPGGRWGATDAGEAATMATGIVSDIAGVVLRVPTDRVATVVSGDVEKIAHCTAWWHADDDAPMTDSERHGFLRRQGVFDERMTAEERYSMLEEWANDVDVKIGIAAGF